MGSLTCRGLARRPWFESVDLDLAAGEIVVLTGPTGAGKSLLLRALADLDPVDGGEVLLDGTATSALPPHRWRARVVYVHPGAVRLVGTVEDNFALIRELGVHGGRFARAEEVDLPRDADAERLSSGEGQRLALARALAVEPDVLLLDEPTSALDPDSARAAEASVLAFAARGGTVLWISHDPALAERVGARRVRWEELTAP